MKTAGLLPRLLACLSPLAATTAAPAETSPNVIFILADDLGVGDLACYGNPHIDTPVLDELAAGGLRLTSHYSPSPLCAPARAGYLSGRFNHRTGAVDVPSNRGLDRLDLSEKTFGDYFRSAGYATALIGKWHNGAHCRDHLPHQRGFDLFFGFPNGGQDYWNWNLLRNDTHVPHDGRYLTVALTDAAVEFVTTNRDRPFALFLAHHAPHSPLQAPDDLVTKYSSRLGPDTSRAVVLVYAMIEAMDTAIGRLLAALDDHGLRGRTMIVFTSDNGAYLGRDPEHGAQERFAGGLSGNKGDMLEQGVRVPCLVSWPGKLPAGRVLDTPVHGCDWLPTLFSLANAAPPPDAKPLDGQNIMPLLLGGEAPDLENRALFFQRNRYAPVRHSNAAIRQGRWKLFWPGDPSTLKKDGARDAPPYRRGLTEPHWEMPLDAELDAPSTAPQPPPRLYDLAQDPAETTDLAGSHPELAERLARAHNAWFSEVDAEWREARRRILEHDTEYWRGKKSASSGKLDAQQTPPP
jgi:arylsulfatase A-like enzyme